MLETYFTVVSSPWLARGFFAITLVVDAACIYAALFNQDLFRRAAERLFGALSGMPVRSPPASNELAPRLAWVAFWVVSLTPMVAWVGYECWLRR